MNERPDKQYFSRKQHEKNVGKPKILGMLEHGIERVDSATVVYKLQKVSLVPLTVYYFTDLSDFIFIF